MKIMARGTAERRTTVTKIKRRMKKMWMVKRFGSYEAAKSWMLRNKRRFQCELVFLDNGFGVEYRRLRRVY